MRITFPQSSQINSYSIADIACLVKFQGELKLVFLKHLPYLLLSLLQ